MEVAKLTGFKQLVAKLAGMAAKAKTDSEATVKVGYTASHALWVHEIMEPKTLGQGIKRPSGLGVFWGPSHYGPKFLEGPAREFRKDLGKIAADLLRAGRTMAQALLAAGFRLQRESQKRVPVEHETLKQSAFTRLEK
jgi:hypothetical protein